FETFRGFYLLLKSNYGIFVWEVIMKKLKFLFVLLIGILIIPCSTLVVNAAESENDPVNIYFFYGDGCPHCAEAEEFFDSIEDEYGDMYNIVFYETWSNDD